MQDRKRETADALQNVGGDSSRNGSVWRKASYLRSDENHAG